MLAFASCLKIRVERANMWRKLHSVENLYNSVHASAPERENLYLKTEVSSQ